MKLNLGCGPDHMPGWTNVDYDESLKPDVVADLRHLPFDDGVATHVFASHVLEHFRWDEPVLEEWHRVLRPGGEIVVIVPDIIGVHALWKKGAAWGAGTPIDLAYVNATAFGARVLGGMWDVPGQEHKQIFVEHMLLERMLPLFPGAQEIVPRSEGEVAVMGRKAN